MKWLGTNEGSLPRKSPAANSFLVVHIGVRHLSYGQLVHQAYLSSLHLPGVSVVYDKENVPVAQR